MKIFLNHLAHRMVMSISTQGLPTMVPKWWVNICQKRNYGFENISSSKWWKKNEEDGYDTNLEKETYIINNIPFENELFFFSKINLLHQAGNSK